MKILIKTIAELQLYLKVDSTYIVSTLFPYQEEAISKYLRNILGNSLTDELLTYYNAPVATPPDPPINGSEMENLLPYAQRVIAKFAFFLGAPNMDLKLTDAGFGVVSNQNIAPASKERVNRFVSSLESDGWDAIETLLRFLELNKDDYPGWENSDAYTLQLRNFINSAEEFDKYVNINKSRLRFMNFRNIMDDIEILKIEPVISKPLADLIRDEIRSNTLQQQHHVILPMIKRAIANYVAASEIDLKHKLTADHYLAEVRKILDATPEAYPLYQLSLFIADRSYQSYENSEDNAFFVAGL
ncbi:MAG: hypothetical protein K0B15_11835 [Lentimicrobium sp.]|nr:hypothetical protein [Lentimicrobium sp.]